MDTKTDENQLVPGQFLLLKDGVFTIDKEFIKRNGNAPLSPILSSSGYGVSTFKKELVLLDNNSLSSYSPYSKTLLPKGNLFPCDLNVSSIIKDKNQQTQVDSAYNSTGNTYLYTYIDSSLGTSYVIVDGITGQQILKGSLASNFIKPRAFSVGNYLVIVCIDTSVTPFLLTMFSFLVTNIAIGLPVAISATVDNVYPKFDGCVLGNNLYLSWNGSGVKTAFFNSNLVQQGNSSQSGENANGCISVFADNNRNYVWTIYYDNTSAIRYFVQNGSNLGNILAPANFLTGTSNIVNITGYAMDGAAKVYYQVLNNYSYAINSKQVRSDYINFAPANDVGIVGSTGLFIRSLALHTKAALYNAQPYFVTTYGPSIVGATTANQGYEPTYFLLTGATSGTRAQVVSKFAAGNAGGYSSSSQLTSFNSIGGYQYQFGYLQKDLIASQGPAWNVTGGVYFQTPGAPLYSQTGINSGNVNFYNPKSFSAVEMGNNLNINGGMLWNYDGQNVVENNFNLFPEDMLATSASSAGGLGAATYSYISLYSWTDNQGNVHRSAPSVPLIYTLGAAAQIQLNIPTLRVTHKKNVAIEIYRTTPSINTNIYTTLTAPQNPILSSTGADSITFTDFVTDSQLNGNALLYTTGGVLEDIGPPPFCHVGRYGNRLIGIQSENRNVFWYSKELLENTPVEMSDFQTQFVNPKYGDLTCGIEMDDKYIFFKSGACLYLNGTGPNATGGENDFGEPILIDGSVGTVNPKSLVLTPDGVMFDSGKGIWILTRNLDVAYIGAPVEAYNQYDVSSATLIPNTTQIRFGLDGTSTVLLYDYFYKRWGVFTGHNVISATVWNGLYTWLQPGSRYLMQETPGVYSDNGRPVLPGLTTGWLSLAGIQGYQRVSRLYLLGKYQTPHILNVSVAYDYDDTIVQTGALRPVAKPAYGGDPFYGASTVYGGASNVEQFRMNMKRQKCQSIQVTIQEAMDTANYVLGAGCILEAIGVTAGMKSDRPRLAASKIVK